MRRLKTLLLTIFMVHQFVFSQSPCGSMDVITLTDTTICNGQAIVVSANPGFESYEWNNGQTSQSITIIDAGTYTVEAYFNTNNLVTNGNFNAGNTSFSSSYTYNATSLWNEGTYAVTNNASNVHPNFNGTGTGNFLVVNGSTSPGTEVWCQDVIVDPSTTYNFSTIVNSVAGISNPAQLQFSINGNVIGNQFSAPGSTGIWNEFNATWASGTNTVAEICIVNQNISGSGNDFGLDNITFTTLCATTDSLIVTETLQANATIIDIDELCENDDPVSLTSFDAGGTWSGDGISNSTTGLFDPSISGDGEFIISYEIAGACGNQDTTLITVAAEFPSQITALEEICMNEPTLQLNGFPNPGTWSGNGIVDNQNGFFNPSEASVGLNTISFQPNGFCMASSSHTIEVFEVVMPLIDYTQEICFGDNVELFVDGYSFADYLWFNNSTAPTLFVTESGSYSLFVTDDNDCEQELIYEVLDKEDCELIVMPNIFTPNNDYENDLFTPIHFEHIPSATMKIFNRWGTNVFYTQEVEKGWDGNHFKEPCINGVYYWLIEYETNKGFYKTATGHVNLLR